MTRDDVAAFVQRDWTRVAQSKARYWAERKSAVSPADLLRMADALRAHARAVRPDWPSEADRAADIAAHVRVSNALRAVPSLHSR